MRVRGPADWRLLGPTGRDALLASALTLLVQQDLWLSPDLGHRVGPRPLVACFYAVTSFALIGRRRWPLEALAFVWTVGAVQYVAYGAPESLGAFLPPLVALYSAGRHAPARGGLVAIPISVTGMAIHESLDPQFRWSGVTFFFWAILAVAWPIGQAFRRRDVHIDTLAAQAEALERQREERTRAAIVAERARIGRELHDVVGHGLSVVVLQLEAALGLLDSGATARLSDRLVATQRSARLAMAEMRRLIGLLDEDDDAALSPQPGLAELDRLIADTRAAGAQVDTSMGGDPVDLPPGLDLAAFRVAQEALTNVLRHARPPIARVSVVYAPHEVVVEVADSGQQPTVNGVDRSAGRGITGMRERVALYGGELEVGPQPAGGFLVRARFPFEGARA